MKKSNKSIKVISLEDRLSNKQLIKQKAKRKGLEIGCWDNDMEKLPKEELNLVLNKIGFGGSDIQIVIGGIDYIVEYNEVDEECDFSLKTRVEYENLYGEIYEEDWER